MNTATREAIKLGWNMRDKVENPEQFADLLELRRLNERSKTAWELENNGNASRQARARAERTQARADAAAEAICQRHGWEVSAPGLWWEVRNGKGEDITVRV